MCVSMISTVVCMQIVNNNLGCLMSQGPAVGVFPPERKLTQSWFIPEWSDAGMGGRSCRNLQEVAVNEKMTAKGRAAFLVRHR